MPRTRGIPAEIKNPPAERRHYERQKKMRTENKRMQDFLAQNGIESLPKFIWSGTLKGSWRLGGVKPYPDTEPWTMALAEKLNGLGFVSIHGRPLDRFDGNGGMFCAFARGHIEFVHGVTPPAGATYRAPASEPKTIAAATDSKIQQAIDSITFYMEDGIDRDKAIEMYRGASTFGPESWARVLAAIPAEEQNA